MNRVEDEQLRFFFKHEARIREWAALEEEAHKFVHRFYGSLQGDLDAALKEGRFPGDEVESCRHGGPWPVVGLCRRTWPRGNDDPKVLLEWSRKTALFPPQGWVACGVRWPGGVGRSPFDKARTDYRKSSKWWPAYRDVDPPADGFWEGDNLGRYRACLVETLLTAWTDLAPLVDEALGT